MCYLLNQKLLVNISVSQFSQCAATFCEFLLTRAICANIHNMLNNLANEGIFSHVCGQSQQIPAVKKLINTCKFIKHILYVYQPVIAEMCCLCPHTREKHGLVHQIIHHIEYLAQVARVNKGSQNVPAHRGNWLTLLFKSKF